MGLVMEAVAAATATVDYDIASGKRWQSSKRRRAIRRVGLVGSAAAADTKVEISYGSEWVASLYNGRGGASIAPQDTDMIAQSTALILDPGEDIHCIVTDAPVTNQIILALDIVDLP